jgi:hypothetical protein
LHDGQRLVLSVVRPEQRVRKPTGNLQSLQAAPRTLGVEFAQLAHLFLGQRRRRDLA